MYILKPMSAMYMHVSYLPVGINKKSLYALPNVLEVAQVYHPPLLMSMFAICNFLRLRVYWPSLPSIGTLLKYQDGRLSTCSIEHEISTELFI